MNAYEQYLKFVMAISASFFLTFWVACWCYITDVSQSITGLIHREDVNLNKDIFSFIP